MIEEKMLFIDRDGTLVLEPEDYQIDSLDKIKLVKGAISSLIKLKESGYKLIMITNQDGVGSDKFPREKFQICHDFILDLFSSQGVKFEDILICPHFENENCVCRKPKIGLVTPYLKKLNRNRSFVIGDRKTDIQLADNMGIEGYLISEELNWYKITDSILGFDQRIAKVSRKTKETDISVEVNLDSTNISKISTGLNFFDHMLEQLPKHGNFQLNIAAKGDLHIDEHHTVEDVAITLGEAIKKALGEKRAIDRYGFHLPMDEASVLVSLDLGGRAFLKFDGNFSREKVGDLPTELVPHFFKSIADSLNATVHIEFRGENDHHQIEAVFKGFSKALGKAIVRSKSLQIPSTKGII